MIFPKIIYFLAFINFSIELDPEQVSRATNSVIEMSRALLNPQEAILRKIQGTTLHEFTNFFLPECMFGVQQVGFFLYTRENIDGTRVTMESQDIPIMDNVKTFFIIHGFVSMANDTSFNDLMRAVLTKYDINVISVDWKEAACSTGFVLSDILAYQAAAKNTRKVGEFVAKFIEKLHREHALEYENVLVAGHSLGAHVAGFTGKAGQRYGSKKYFQIIGMDPAGPGFRNKNCDQRLCITDADFVNVFHTTRSYGLTESIGHVDFFFNGSLRQPGCRDGTCSHYRAVHYLMESILNHQCFTATPYDLKSGSFLHEAYCQRSTCTFPNVYSYAYPARGTFYVKTETYPSDCKVPPNET